MYVYQAFITGDDIMITDEVGIEMSTNEYTSTNYEDSYTNCQCTYTGMSTVWIYVYQHHIHQVDNQMFHLERGTLHCRN